MEFLTVILLVSVLLLVFLLIRQSATSHPDYTSALQMMQQQVESLRSDMRASLQHTTETLNIQLHSITQQVQQQTESVGSRLDTAARVIGDVRQNLGELGKATQEIKELGQGVSKLEEILRAPKLRGGLGEVLLEELLKQVVPVEHFAMQYRFTNGHIVDAIVRTSDRIVPIDSKFPLENFRKMHSASSEQERKAYQKTFINDVRKHIDAIATKYIIPDEGTFPFALMYIPSETIYYEIILHNDTASGDAIENYAIEQRVIPVSPNSFYAYLQVIALGLRGLKVEQRAQHIINALSQLQTDIARVHDTFETLGTHLNNARNKYDETEKRLNTFEQHLSGIAMQSTASSHHEQPLQLIQ